MDGSQWVVRIRSILNEELEDSHDISPSISAVPKPMIVVRPEAYIPQLIALGPYHHSREELHQMERHKLYAAKQIQIRLKDQGFDHIVDMLRKSEYRIRAHYQRYLPFNGETLAWMMAIDASFLLEFLQIFSSSAQNSLRIPSRITRSVSSTRRTSTHDMLVRDIVMLENQLPLFLLLKILELHVTTPQLAEETLTLMLVAFLKELTPFKMATNFQPFEPASHSHLLELLYLSITPMYDEEHLDSNETPSHNDCPQKLCGFIKYVFVTAKVFILARTKALMSLLIKFLIKIPWNIVTSIPTFAVLKLPVENIKLDSTQLPDQGLSIDEIAIPSVTELTNIGIRFEPTHGDMSSVAFDVKTATLHLPEISLDVNSEVTLRNLVAYEATIITGPLAFTRYVELMNGIIDTEEDAKMLRERGVIVNRLRSDKEVAEMWNGMSRSMRLTKVKVLDEVIEEVNKYYNGRWKVKMGRFMRRYVVSSWESLIVVIVIFLLVVVLLQVFSTTFGFLFGSLAHRRIGRP